MAGKKGGRPGDNHSELNRAKVQQGEAILTSTWMGGCIRARNSNSFPPGNVHRRPFQSHGPSWTAADAVTHVDASYVASLHVLREDSVGEYVQSMDGSVHGRNNWPHFRDMDFLLVEGRHNGRIERPHNQAAFEMAPFVDDPSKRFLRKLITNSLF